MTDDVLIAKTNEAAGLEWERQQKFKKSSRETKVREIRADIQPVKEASSGAICGREQSFPTPTKEKVVKAQPTMTCKESELLDIISQLRGNC